MKPLNLNSILATLILLSVVLKANAGDEEKSLLWKISGNGLQQESYLFGTIHIICKDQFFVDERIENALASTQKIALELNMMEIQLLRAAGYTVEAVK